MRAAASIVPGWPGFAGLAVVVVVGAGLLAWVLTNKDRTAHLVDIIKAWRQGGDGG